MCPDTLILGDFLGSPTSQNPSVSYSGRGRALAPLDKVGFGAHRCIERRMRLVLAAKVGPAEGDCASLVRGTPPIPLPESQSVQFDGSGITHSDACILALLSTPA
jgi:hypothetical protein